ncbi:MULTISPECIES: restriction endonuclease subunit S [Streptomyces]|uniref:restriction endonuclease subunit S n=1 Tax=Streptomyces TaxID=1883 RepID=UPI0015FF0461|nr:restriction endonuclease subunit S [Streptomyces murinus]MBA9049224.1 type I restriction enzyme S subunit [Streptomyces murinus]
MTNTPPTPWKTCRVKFLTIKIGSGKTPSGGAETYVDEGVLFLRSQNVHIDGLRLDDAAYINPEVHRDMRSTRVKACDTLLNITGASLGRVALVPDEMGEANVNQHVCIVRPSSSIEARYLAYALTAQITQEQISALQVGGNRDGLNFEQVGNLEIPLPQLEEQRRIVDFLDTETQRIKTLLTVRKHQVARVNERFTSSLTSQVEAMIADYGVIGMRHAISSVEQGWSPQCEDRIAEKDEWAVLKTSAVSSGKFDPAAHKALPKDLPPDFRYAISDGDLLMTRGSGSPDLVGVAAVVRTSGRRLLLSDLLYRVTPLPEWSSTFLAYVLRSRRIRGEISLLFRGQSGQTIKLRGEDVKAIPVPNVPPSKQSELTTLMAQEESAVSAALGSLQRSCDLLAERRQALITAAVTGQLDVTTARGVDAA